jgi:hypothetical protein
VTLLNKFSRQSLLRWTIKEPFRSFAHDEWDYPLIITYKVFAWMLRDEADTLHVVQEGFIWYRRGVQAGKLLLQGLVPATGYRELVYLIMDRDSVMHMHLEKRGESAEEVIYQFTYL